MYNRPGYKWYVVWMKPEPRDSRILSAWEFKNDAEDDLAEVQELANRKRSNELFEVVAKRTCVQKGLDPDDDLNWLNLGDVFLGDRYSTRNPEPAVHARTANKLESRLADREGAFRSASGSKKLEVLVEYARYLGEFTCSLDATQRASEVDLLRIDKWERKLYTMQEELEKRLR